MQAEELPLAMAINNLNCKIDDINRIPKRRRSQNGNGKVELWKRYFSSNLGTRNC